MKLMACIIVTLLLVALLSLLGGLYIAYRRFIRRDF